MPETLSLSNHLKLKGGINYVTWKAAIEATIKGNRLGKYFRKNTKVPAFVDKDDEDVNKEELKVYQEQDELDRKAQLLIINSILTNPTSIVIGKPTTLTIQEALKH